MAKQPGTVAPAPTYRPAGKQPEQQDWRRRAVLAGLLFLVLIGLYVLMQVLAGPPREVETLTLEAGSMAGGGDGVQPVPATERERWPRKDDGYPVGLVLGELGERLGYYGPALDHVDRHQTLKKSPLPDLAKRCGGVLDFREDDGELVLTVDRLEWRRQDRNVRTHLLDTVKDEFPEEAAKFERVGLRVYATANSPRLLADVLTAPGGELVVLVPGLESPHEIWTDLRPALLEAGVLVAELRYPVDGGVVESAKLLAAELAAWREKGGGSVALVGHGLGGLVCREALSSPDLLGGGGKYPPVTDLVLVGTPNQGVALAELLLTAKQRQLVCRQLSGDGLLFGAAFDGAADSQKDLTVGSEVLTALAERPALEIPVTVIAGKSSPLTEKRIEVALAATENAGEDTEAFGPALREACAEVLDGSGDGFVSLASTALDGTETQVCDANHATLLQAVGDGQAPAIPLIVQVVASRDDGADEFAP